jgi:hypothetical protein
MGPLEERKIPSLAVTPFVTFNIRQMLSISRGVSYRNIYGRVGGFEVDFLKGDDSRKIFDVLGKIGQISLEGVDCSGLG